MSSQVKNLAEQQGNNNVLLPLVENINFYYRKLSAATVGRRELEPPQPKMLRDRTKTPPVGVTSSYHRSSR